MENDIQKLEIQEQFKMNSGNHNQNDANTESD